MLSSSKAVNPEYYDWNKVFLLYCDGTYNQGYKSKPVKVDDKNEIYFRGEKNFKGVLNDLKS